MATVAVKVPLVDTRLLGSVDAAVPSVVNI